MTSALRSVADAAGNGSSCPTGTLPIDQPSRQRRSKNAGAWRRPGSATARCPERTWPRRAGRGEARRFVPRRGRPRPERRRRPSRPAGGACQSRAPSRCAGRSLGVPSTSARASGAQSVASTSAPASAAANDGNASPQPSSSTAPAGEVERRHVVGERHPARPQLGPVGHELVLLEALLVDQASGSSGRAITSSRPPIDDALLSHAASLPGR